MDTQQIHQSAKTLGIVSLITAFLFFPAGIICGHLSLGKYKKLGGVTEGKGLAVAGLIISYVNLAITLISIIASVALVGAAASEMSTY